MENPPEGTPRPFAAQGEMGFAIRVMLYILVGAVFFLTFYVADLYVFFMPPAPELNNYEFPDAEFATVYSDPIPTFNISENDVAITDQTSDELDIGIEDELIYAFGYVSADGIKWKRVALLPGEGASEGDEGWILRNATYEYIIDAEAFNITAYPYTATGYITLYSCSRSVIGQWDCHDGWQMQEFNVVVTKEQAGAGDACGGCAQGFTCVQGSCMSDESAANSARVGAGESLSIFVNGKEYLLTVTSISGDGSGAKVSINGQAFTIDKSTGDVYLVKDELHSMINKIQPFTSDTDGYLEIIVTGDYDSMTVCENCVYKPPATSGGGGGGGGGGGSSCTPKTCAYYNYECGVRSDGCTGTLSCGTCDTGAGYECDAGQCVASVCTPDCTDASGICTGSTFPDGCGGTCTGTLAPDCAGLECGLSPNTCGYCNTTDNYCVVTYGAGSNCQSNGRCGAAPCVPNCAGKDCGSNGCGGICGNCSTWPTSHEYFTCNTTSYLCTPNCDSGFANCNAVRTDGCEGNLTTDQYCGSCSMTCIVPEYCVNCAGVGVGQCAGHSGLTCLTESPFLSPPVLPGPP
jgi:hypothetical protein